MAADLPFVHLHVHSSYSLLEGALSIARLAELAKKDRQPALALTDTDNMFGALEFSEKIAGYGIQPIIGCALGVDFGDRDNRGTAIGEDRPRLVLLATREDGYRSLMRLSSRARTWLPGFQKRPMTLRRSPWRSKRSYYRTSGRPGRRLFPPKKRPSDSDWLLAFVSPTFN